VAHWHLYVKIKYNNSLVTGLLHLLLLGWPGIQLSKHFDVCISPAVAITIFIDRRVLINCLNYIRLLLLLLLFAGPTKKLPHRTALESFGKITVQQQAINRLRGLFSPTLSRSFAPRSALSKSALFGERQVGITTTTGCMNEFRWHALL